FNTLVYYCLFLVPAAIMFRAAPAVVRPWVCVLSGLMFFVYFSATLFGGWWGAACVLIFLWEAAFRTLYRPNAAACVVGILVNVLILGVFKYWNFITGLITAPFGSNPFQWEGAFLPLGVSFFTFEFIHYAADRYRGRVERGTTGEYLAFIFFFPTMVAGPINRFPYSLP